MLESQYAPARDDHENLGSLVESGLSFWKQAKSNAKEVGPRRMKGLFPGRWVSKVCLPQPYFSQQFLLHKISKDNEMLEAASRGQQHIHYE